MMLTGKISKNRGAWLAECEIIGAFTDGSSRKEACAMLADCIATQIDPANLKVTVTEIGELGPNEFAVLVEADKPTMLAAEVLSYQREKNGLSLAQVAAKLGASSRNAYARYEQGSSVPSLDKYIELLAVVAPDMAMVIGPRKTKVAR